MFKKKYLGLALAAVLMLVSSQADAFRLIKDGVDQGAEFSLHFSTLVHGGHSPSKWSLTPGAKKNRGKIWVGAYWLPGVTGNILPRSLDGYQLYRVGEDSPAFTIRENR